MKDTDALDESTLSMVAPDLLTIAELMPPMVAASEVVVPLFPVLSSIVPTLPVLEPVMPIEIASIDTIPDLGQSHFSLNQLAVPADLISALSVVNSVQLLAEGAARALAPLIDAMSELRKSIEPALGGLSGALSMFARQVASGLHNLGRGIGDFAREKLRVRASSDPVETGKRRYLLLMQECLRVARALLTAARWGSSESLQRHSHIVLLNSAPNGPSRHPAREIAVGVAA